MAPFILVIVAALFLGPVFLYFFQKYPMFSVNIYGFG